MAEPIPQDLLADLEGEDLDARRALLEWLLERGSSADELREACAEGRLALLPTEHVLTRGCSLSLDEACERSGLERDFVSRVWRAAGIPVPEGDEPIVDDTDLESMQMAKLAVDAGISEDGYVELSRAVGRASESIAEAIVEQTVSEFLTPGQGEAEFAMRLEEAAEQLTPMIPILVSFPVRMHLRDALRHQALDQAEDGVESLRGTRELAIAFADLVGFSALSEQVAVTESGRVAARLEELAAAVAQSPVRLVKLIGDAAMFVSDEVAPLVEALVELRARASEIRDFPALRIGVGAGEVLVRAGDVYGPAVNRASRLADAAAENQLLLEPEAAKKLAGGWDVRQLEPTELKGVGEIAPVEIRGVAV